MKKKTLCQNCSKLAEDNSCGLSNDPCKIAIQEIPQVWKELLEMSKMPIGHSTIVHQIAEELKEAACIESQKN